MFKCICLVLLICTIILAEIRGIQQVGQNDKANNRMKAVEGHVDVEDVLPQRN